MITSSWFRRGDVRSAGCPVRASCLLVLLSSAGCALATHSERSSRDVSAPQPLVAGAAVDAKEPLPVRDRSSDEAVQRPPVRDEARVRAAPPAAIAPREEAVAILEAAARTDWPLLRANALEAISCDPDLLEPMIMTSLDDENRGVRFVATMLIGRSELCSLRTLVEPLLERSV